MKVYELVTQLLKYPAGYEVNVEVVELNMSDKKPDCVAIGADIEEFEENTTEKTLTLSGTYVK